jgi:hypothetical protein
MIRTASEKDRADVLRIGSEFARETIAIDGDKIFDRMFTKCLNEGVVLVAEDNGVVGFLGGYFEDAPLLGGLVFHEVAWYVSLEHRRFGCLLFSEMERVVREAGAKMIFMIAYGNGSQKLVEALYERKGYKDIEHHWMKRLV